MIRIALIDDEENQLSRYSRYLGMVFDRFESKWEIKQHLVDSKLAGDKMMEKISRQIKEDRPHVIISDAKFGSNDVGGLVLLSLLKRELPEAVTCLLTREKVRSDQFGIRTPNPDIIISKQPLGGDERYQEYVGDQILRFLTHKSNIEVHWLTPFDKAFEKLKDGKGRKANEGEILSLIEQCLFDRTLDGKMKRVLVESLPGGKSGSAVLSCHLSGDLHYGVTAVIKISKKEDAKSEVKNYETYVKWVLPYTWKIEVLGTGETESFGAVCYSFAFDGEGKPVSCTKLLSEGNREATNAVCKSIFNPDSKIWYNQTRLTGKDASEYFQKAPFFTKSTQIPERENKFIDLVKAEFGDDFSFDDDEISLFSSSARRATHAIFTEDWGEVEECISHGDLNANNILVNDRYGVAFIDFQHTGYHNVFRDFVSYESSVRIDYAEDEIASWQDMFENELELSSGREPVVNGYLQDVISVRRAAFQNFPLSLGRDRKNLYLITTYIHLSWLVVRFSGEWNPTASKRLMIGALAALFSIRQHTDL